MVKSLCSYTVCQVVTLRDVGFSWSKLQKQLKIKSRFSAQYAYNRYLKNNSFEAQKSSGRPPKLSKKSEKKLDADVLEDSKTSLERFRVAHNALDCYDTISRDTWRFFKKCCKKVSLKNKSKCFRSKWCINMLKKPLFFWQNVVFTNETRVRISSDGIVRVFRRNGTRFLEKNTKNLSSDKRSLMFWGAIRLNGQKLLVKCPNKLNAVGYLEILKIYEKKCISWTLFFSKIMLQCINRRLSAISSKKTEWPAYSPNQKPIEVFGQFWSSDYENRQFFWENLEEKVYEIWNEIDADVVRNLYENYLNRLLDVKKAKGIMTRY